MAPKTSGLPVSCAIDRLDSPSSNYEVLALDRVVIAASLRQVRRVEVQETKVRDFFCVLGTL